MQWPAGQVVLDLLHKHSCKTECTIVWVLSHVGHINRFWSGFIRSKMPQGIMWKLKQIFMDVQPLRINNLSPMYQSSLCFHHPSHDQIAATILQICCTITTTNLPIMIHLIIWKTALIASVWIPRQCHLRNSYSNKKIVHTLSPSWMYTIVMSIVNEFCHKVDGHDRSFCVSKFS